MNFKALSLLDISAKVVSFTVTITIAFIYQNYWALIIGNISYSLTMVIVSYKIAATLPRFSTQHFREQWRFSRGIVLTSIFGYLRSKADTFIVSMKFGSSSVGYFSVAQEFALMPLSEFVSPIMGPLYSSLAKVADDDKTLEDKLFKCLSLAYLFIFPSAAGIYFLNNEIVTIVLGAGWEAAAPVLAYLSLLMVVYITNGTFRHAFVLKNKFYGIIMVDILGLLLIAGTLLIPSIDDVGIFSLFRAFIGFIVITATIFIVKIVLNYQIKLFLISLFIPLVTTCCMYLSLESLSFLNALINNVYLYTLCMVLAGGIIYLVTYVALISLLKNKHTIWHFNYSFSLTGYKKALSLLRK